MKIKENPRLVELRLALILNKIANMEDRVKVNNALYVLKSYAMTIDDTYGTLFDNILTSSINEKLLGADTKEICLTAQVFYPIQSDTIKILNTSRNTYMTMYPDMINYVTEEYLNELEPRFAIFSNYYKMCNALSNFYDTYDMINTESTHKYKDLGRQVELKFSYTYDRLKDFFISGEFTNKFIISVCRNLKIDTDIINETLSCRHLIYRKSEEHITANMGLVKELVTFGLIEGWSIGKISTDLLDKNYMYLNNKANLKRDETENDYFMFKWYRPTVLIDEKAIYEVNRFLKVMSDFYDTTI